MKLESAAARAERIIAEELEKTGWHQADLQLRLKSDPAKLRIAARVQRETTLPVKQIAERLHLGSWKSARALLQKLNAERQNRRKENTLV